MLIWLMLHLAAILWTVGLGAPCLWTAFCWWREARRERCEAEDRAEMDARTRRAIINMFHRRAEQDRRDYAVREKDKWKWQRAVRDLFVR